MHKPQMTALLACPFGVDLGLPLRQPPSAHAFEELRDAVRGHPDQTRTEYREQIRGFLRGPPGLGDGRSRRETHRRPGHARVDEGIFATAVAVHPQ